VKSLAPAVLEVIHPHVAPVTQISRFVRAHQEREPVRLDLLVFFAWLVQSQPQLGAASAKSLYVNAELALGLVLKHLLESALCLLGYFDHSWSLDIPEPSGQMSATPALAFLSAGQR
jgi:hypothetical protein